jgi:hypothetical protein
MDTDSAIGCAIVGTAFALTLLGASCTCVVNYQDNAAMVAMVQHGSNPLAARCAVKSGDSACALASK